MAGLPVLVSPYLGKLSGTLSPLIEKKFGLIWGVDDEMKKLASTLSTIQMVLADAEEKQEVNKAVADWLLKLSALAYDADDILDEWAAYAMDWQLGAERATCIKRVCDFFLSCFCLNRLMFRYNIASRVSGLVKGFEQLDFERSKFHLGQGPTERTSELNRNRETSSFCSDDQIFGRDEEKEYIIRLLLNSSDSEVDVSVCTIVDTGGLGKTTLAQSCYNDQRVADHFEVKVWVHVSHHFDVKRLIKAVVGSLQGDNSDIEELDPLQCLLQTKLAGKRFLLVLDDVWNQNEEVWSRFKSPLGCGAPGSSVVVTIRLKKVASITGTNPPCFLKFLSEDDCWSLFRKPKKVRNW